MPRLAIRSGSQFRLDATIPSSGATAWQAATTAAIALAARAFHFASPPGTSLTLSQAVFLSGGRTGLAFSVASACALATSASLTVAGGGSPAFFASSSAFSRASFSASGSRNAA